MVVNFCEDLIFMDFVRFLIDEVLYAWCLRYNICSAWILDIRISTCCPRSQFVSMCVSASEVINN